MPSISCNITIIMAMLAVYTVYLKQKIKHLGFIGFTHNVGKPFTLNLSILISGGKVTNKDSLSNGERSGNSSNLKSPVPALVAWPDPRSNCQGS